jgi:uncharacterized membrane protein YphA (DoxX/SURF4 family)
MRTVWLRMAVGWGLIASLLLSWRLWTGPRLYPLTPVLPFLKPIPFPLDAVLFIALLVLAALIAQTPKLARLISALLAVAVVLAAFDQSRWQPWFYQYLFMLLALHGGRPDVSLNTCRLIVVCTYFWSGVQKLGVNFADDTFAWLAEPLTRFLPASIHPLVRVLGVAAPFVETGIAAGLLFKKTRPAAVSLAIGMHVFILIGIGPWGSDSNNVVWPWNIVMIVCVLLLFWRTDDAGLGDIVLVKHSVAHKLVLILFGMAPLLSFFNLWDSYLSSALYTPNKNQGTLRLNDSVFDKLPKEIQDYATDEGPNVSGIDIADWSFGELNVPPYPEVRIYKSVAKAVCSYADQPAGLRLVVKEKAALIGGGRTISYDCRQLGGSQRQVTEK